MILFELILLIVVGAAFFIVREIAECVTGKIRGGGKNKSERKKHRGEIKADLDLILHSYQQGLLNEEQYLDQTDELIDQLAELLHENASEKV